MISKEKPLVVVAVSGGLDSCTTLAIAVRDYRPAMLHVQYNQRTAKRELKAFEDLADYYDVKLRLITELSYFNQIGGTSLIDKSMEIEKGEPDPSRIPSTYVSFRNAAILCVATSWAEVIGAEKIFIGAVWEDSSGYPDCRTEFFRAFSDLIKLGTRPDSNIEIVTPVINMKKYEIILTGAELNAPYHLTWSCYENEQEACGECESCRLRLKGFSQAGIVDPIKYVKRYD